MCHPRNYPKTVDSVPLEYLTDLSDALHNLFAANPYFDELPNLGDFQDGGPDHYVVVNDIELIIPASENGEPDK